MTSRQRLLAVLRGEIPDRVPVSTYELVGFNSRAWENNEPSYARLMERIRECTDCIAMWNPSFSGECVFLTGLDPQLVERQTWTEGNRRLTRTVLHTPAGPLSALDGRDPDVHTTWHLERFLKDAGDIERFLSLPYRPPEVDYGDLRRIREEVGEHGIIMPSVADPLCLAAELFDMSTFTVVAFTERERFRALLEAFFPRVMNYLRSLLEHGAGDLYRIVGPEYATEPYLPPELFREYVVPYDREMVRLIREYGAYSRFHCHGRLRANLPAIAEVGADAIDPVEPPPDGDVSLREVKQALAGTAVFGNVELKVLEHGSEEEVRQAVRRAMEEGKPGGRFCLMPTAAPINVPLSPRTERNYFLYIETALELAPY